MIIDKNIDRVFVVTYEPDYDQREERREGLVESHEMAAMLCNSAELDFEYLNEDSYGNILLYNANTDKNYVVWYKEALKFFNGEPVVLCPIERGGENDW